MNGLKAPTRIDVAKLAQPDIREAVSSKFADLNFDGTWENFRDQVYSLGVELLGFRKKKQHRDWFDDNDANIGQLLDTKHALYQSLLDPNLRNRPAVEKSFKGIKRLHKKCCNQGIIKLIQNSRTNT